MNPDIKKRWVEALRSGEYKQGKYYLKNGDDFCCLGVLCDLHRKEFGGKWEAGTLVTGLHNHIAGTYAEDASFPSKEVLEWAGGPIDYLLLSRGQTATTAINDGLEYTFTQIADLIEEQL